MADDDGWEVLTGPPQYQSIVEKHLFDFCKAAQCGNITKLQEMLDREDILNVNSQSPSKKETALHYACRFEIEIENDNLETIKFLVENGANVNLKDVRGKHSLHLASSYGYLKIIKYLIEKGANLNFVDKYGRSCLHWAAVNKHYEVVKELLHAGAPVLYAVSNNWQPLHEAVKGGDLRIVKLLVESNALVNPDVKQGKASPFTPLHIAAREGHTECLKYLLECKAHVNAVNQGRQTPLHEAAFRGSKDCCRELIVYGADPHAKNNLERTPLLDACNQGNVQCAIHCLDAGSFVNYSDRIHDTALHHLLKNHGKFPLDDPLHQDKKLSLEKLVSFTDILLQYGANPNLANDEDETGFILANTMQEKEVVDLIFTAMEKPLSLLHIAKCACRRIVRCDHPQVWKLPIPKNLQVYLLQNTSYFSGW